MSYEQPAPEGDRFEQGAFDRQVGQDIPVRVEGRDSTTGRLLKAEVADDGRSVELTLDVDIDLPTGSRGQQSGAAFGFR
ncbi:hypothetical protein B0675_02260 [Streptomyces sp. M41(2017)]|nr:hypothetical protein B0675_02260 [Streptomyces sp. M41(2017)]